MEIKLFELIVGVLVFLNTLGWGIAWALFRTQFGILSSKVDKLPERLGDIEQRLTRLEVHTQHIMTNLENMPGYRK